MDLEISTLSGVLPTSLPTRVKQSIPQNTNIQNMTSIEADPESAVISLGTQCKRRGCEKIYEGDGSRTEECRHHSGEPIFHETMKFWSCCQAKSLDFDDFLKLEGCVVGRHKFLDYKSPTIDTCRKDFYQTPNSVVLSVYAKNVDRKGSSIQFSPKAVLYHSLYLRS
jgi:hypothetical protein